MDAKHPFIFMSEGATKARAIMRALSLRLLPVINTDKKLQGIVTRHEIMAISSAISPILVNGIMTQPRQTATANDDALAVVKNMVRLEWYIPIIETTQDKTYRGVLGLQNFIDAVIRTSPEKLAKIDVPVSDVMTKNVITVTIENQIDNLWRLMQEKNIAGFPVVKKDNRLVGVVSQKDLLDSGQVFPRFESRKGQYRTPAKVMSVMQPNVVTAGPTASAAKVAKVMVAKDIGRVPIVDKDGRLVGIVDREDIVKRMIA
jgi:CBS domain-containing protein